MDPTTQRLLQAAAAGAVNEDPVYVEDVFSTFLYEGNESSRDIVNDIDLSTEGGMVWIKNRESSSRSHRLFDTERGVHDYLEPSTSVSEATDSTTLTAFNTNGFSLGSDSNVNESSASVDENASWTFRKQPGFFDVVTYTGNATAGRTVAHDLGSAPGMIWVKSLSTGDWYVYHRSLGATKYLILNETDNDNTLTSIWNDTDPTATEFTLGSGSTNSSGVSYVAYLFAHDDTRFGPSNDESIIACGSYTGNGNSDGPVIDLGWEPQWVMIKKADGNGNRYSWWMFDTRRQIRFEGTDRYLAANNDNGEISLYTAFNLTSSGFELDSAADGWNESGGTFVYMAIRRPDKAPESGSDFLELNTRSGTGSFTEISSSFDVDWAITRCTNDNLSWRCSSVGLGNWSYLEFNDTTGLSNSTNHVNINPPVSRSFKVGGSSSVNGSGRTYVDYMFRRARGAFDIVYYNGTGSNTTVEHGLQAVPELIILKRLTSNVFGWYVYHSGLSSASNYIQLDNAEEQTNTTIWNATAPTSSVFSLGTNPAVNNSGSEYVAYLFSSVSGIIDVGSYTGTGTSGLQVDCGFTSGARFVLIKNRDTFGEEWLLFDTERGIVAGNDPLLEFSNDSTQDDTQDMLDPYSAGFEIASTLQEINANNQVYIYLAIA